MALTTDQIMMLAHLADFAGSKMAPDNPFAGYASQYVQARNFAKLLQQAAVPPEAPPKEAPKEETTSALTPPNPFVYGGNYKTQQMPEVTQGHRDASVVSDWVPMPSAASAPTVAPDSNYKTQQMPGVTPEHKDATDIDWLFEPGVKGTMTVDENNVVTQQRKMPANKMNFSKTGSISKMSDTSAPYRNAAAQKVTNPFWYLG